MTRVLIADDQTLIRQAVTAILESDPDIEVIGEASDGASAIAQARLLHPDVILMDIRMPGINGIQATAAICEDPELTDVHVMVLTTFEEDDNVVAALRAGASGFLGKGAEPEDIIRSVKAIHAGETLLSPAATRSLVERYIRGTAPLAKPVQLEQLTEREREVLLLVARGLSNADIASALFISPHTAKTHVNRIMTKVHAHDRAQLVILAYESGLLTPGE